MNATDDRAKSIFLNAVEIAAPEDRRAFVESQCAGDESLRGEVEELLRHQQSLGSFLEPPPSGLEATVDELESGRPGTVIGPYKLQQQIGEGGMGVVFMAEQTAPLQRTVALKIIKPGMDSRQVIARFEAERQAVAVMDHPNVAKVLDAGTTDSGRPYFVMELVKGTPITTYCDDKHLPVRERLELFTQVCHAVQHAHQKGVIHRDIKPTNVLVAEYDHHVVPKVIDFGVAKATGQRLTERTMFTEFGQVLGTLEYMSPEQAKLNQLDVDTRSDVYSLGVLLYELLTGSTPIERTRLQEAAFDEMLRIIREEEPPKPSTRLTSSHLLPSIASNRGSEPVKLNRLVRGELDWIVMKALEKDRGRRFESVSGFAADVERHLRDEPVHACPPSAAYRFHKFAKRNKAALLATALVGTAMILGLAGTTWQAVRATRAERLSNVQRDRAVEAEARAKSEGAVAKAVNAFLNRDLLGQVGPYLPYDKFDESRDELKLVTVLDRAARQLDGGFANQPLVEAALRQTIGLTYLSFDSDKSRAIFHLKRAVELRRIHLGDEHPDTLASMQDLALAASDPDLVGRVLNIRRRVLGRHHRTTLHTLFSTAMVARDKGEKARAIDLLRETWEAQRSALGESDTHTAWTMHCLAHTLVLYAGRDGIPPADDREVELLYRNALAVYRKHHFDATWQAFDIIARLAEFLSSRHRYEEAEALLLDAVKRIRSLPGASSEMTGGLANLLESVYRDWGKPQRAAELNRQRSGDKANREFVKEAEFFSQAIQAQPDRWESWNGRAWANFRLRLWDDAITDYSKAIELAPEVHTNWFHRGLAYLELAQWDNASADFTKVVQGWPNEPGGWYCRALAFAHSEPEKAIADLRQAIATGFHDAVQMSTDSRLNPLRSNTEFRKLLAALEEPETD